VNAQANYEKLQEVLMQFSTEQTLPDERLLNVYVTRYPEFERELVECAAALVQDRLSLRGDAATDIVSDPVAERAISRFHSLRFAEQSTGQFDSNVVIAENPIARLDSNEYDALMGQLGVPSSFVRKLRDRLVIPSTIPDAFIRRLAILLKVSTSDLKAHFWAPQQLVRLAFVQSSASKEERQSFADALRSCGLDPEEVDRLLVMLSRDE
jgi:hypothetical protein